MKQAAPLPRPLRGIIPPMVTPLPSTPKVERTSSLFMTASPSLWMEPALAKG